MYLELAAPERFAMTGNVSVARVKFLGSVLAPQTSTARGIAVILLEVPVQSAAHHAHQEETNVAPFRVSTGVVKSDKTVLL